ncbi:MAG TPA: hypothetical protein GX708_16725 [Gallicola sp.]|nr:hypothetical protein [Gallicola sp.]
MKVIDLLNKIAKGEEVPKKIKYDTKNYYFRNYDYKEYDIVENCIDEQTSFIDCIDFYKLNDEIEIIENIEKGGRMIEKIRQFCEYPYSDKYECWSIKEDILVNKINEIIDVVNELKKESDK